MAAFEYDMATKHALVSLLQTCNELQIGEDLRPGMLRLMTTVDLYDDLGSHKGRRVLILTKNLFLVCKEDLSHWDFPRYWKDETEEKNAAGSGPLEKQASFKSPTLCFDTSSKPDTRLALSMSNM